MKGNQTPNVNPTPWRSLERRRYGCLEARQRRLLLSGPLRLPLFDLTPDVRPRPENLVILSEVGRHRSWVLPILGLVMGAAGLRAEDSRRLSIQLDLSPTVRTWWKKALPANDVDGVLLSWGLALVDEDGRVKALSPQLACSQDPICLSWSSLGERCLDLLAPSSPIWGQHYSCYADGRITLFGQEQNVVELAVPKGVSRARVSFYVRDSTFRRTRWKAQAVDGEADVILRLDPEEGFALNVQIQLVTRPGGEPADLRIASCRPQGGDPEKVAARIRSNEFRYCELAPGRLTAIRKTSGSLRNPNQAQTPIDRD